MKVLLTFVIILFATEVSASDPDKVLISESQFPVVNLDSNPLGAWMNGEVLLPRSIQIKKDFLLVFENDFRVDEQLVKIFSLTQEKKLGYYGRSGSGPGEIQGGLQTLPVYGLFGQIRFMDFVRNRISVVDIENIIEGNHYKEPAIYKVMPPQFIQMQYGAILNDSLVVGGGSLRDGKVLFGNYKTNEFKIIDFIPETGLISDPSSVPNVYLTHMAVNSNKEKIVVSNLHFNQIEIFDYHGDLDFVITDDHSNQEFDNRPHRWHTRNTVEYYRSVITTDEYIMAIYYNMTDYELREDNGEFREDVKSSIRVFNWKGEPVVQYNLDQRITIIAFDESNRRIIALAPDVLDSIITYSVDL